MVVLNVVTRGEAALARLEQGDLNKADPWLQTDLPVKNFRLLPPCPCAPPFPPLSRRGPLPSDRASLLLNTHGK